MYFAKLDKSNQITDVAESDIKPANDFVEITKDMYDLVIDNIETVEDDKIFG